MRTAQRGSVLLSVIAGILILAVIGTVTVSLMTSSVMTAVDGKEALQATYLAESGKEIVRARTAKLSGGALMEEAQALETLSKENGGKGIAVSNNGFVKVSLYPSWFRWYDGKLNTTASGWHGGAPTDKVEFLFIDQGGAKRYRYSEGNPAEGKPTSQAADVYLIGRVSDEASIRYKDRTLTVAGYSGFGFFPQSGGLIGLIPHQGNVPNATDTTVSSQRFTYDTFDYKTGTFTNITPLSDEEISEETFKDKDIVLGQYFRVVCEATTTNGARAALVWHTNGRNSLRFGESGGTGGGEGLVGSNNAKDLVDLFGGTVNKKSNKHDEDDGIVTGSNILGKLEAEDYYDDDDDVELKWDFDDSKGSKPDKIKINHFLKMGGTGGNQEYWSAAVATPWLAYDPIKKPALQSIMQYSFDVDDDDNYFTGILCRLGFLSGFSSSSVTNNGDIGQSYGVKGIGVGVMQAQISFYGINMWQEEVKTASVNPALLPGFFYEKKSFRIYTNPDKIYWYGTFGYPGKLGMTLSDKNKLYTQLYPLLVVWAYDDAQSGETDGEIKTLKPLAIAVLDEKEHLSFEAYLTLTVKVVEEEGKNYLTVWLEKASDDQVEKSSAPHWPSSKYKVTNWLYPSSSYPVQDVYISSTGEIVTPLATGENYRRAGIFAEAYAFKNENEHADIKIGNFFFTGTGMGMGELSPGGLTPGITN